MMPSGLFRSSFSIEFDFRVPPVRYGHGWVSDVHGSNRITKCDTFFWSFDHNFYGQGDNHSLRTVPPNGAQHAHLMSQKQKNNNEGKVAWINLQGTSLTNMEQRKKRITALAPSFFRVTLSNNHVSLFLWTSRCHPKFVMHSF